MKKKIIFVIITFGLFLSLFVANSFASNSSSPKILPSEGPTYQVNTIPFQWIDITSTGTHLSLGDDFMQNVSLPFVFPFYDESFYSILISSNGFFTFDDSIDLYHIGGIIPQTYLQYAIGLFWADLYPDDDYGGGGVYYQSFGDYVVIQYDNISTCCSGDLAGNFEAVLHSSGLIQMYYDLTNDIYGTIGVDRGDNADFTTYPLGLYAEEVGIEFSRGAGVVITSSPYYTEGDTEYTIIWSPMGTPNVDYYEVFIDGESYTTTTGLSATILVSFPESYEIEVVLYTTGLDTFSDEIYLTVLDPIIKGLYEGAYLVYRFNYSYSETDFSHMIYRAELVDETSPYLWLVNVTMSIFEYEDSTEPRDISSMSQELDAAFLSTPGLFWSNAHQLSLGDEMIGIGETGTIIDEQTLEFPELEMSFDCWVTEIPMGEYMNDLASVFYCKYTGVLIAIESSESIEGRLIEFDYPFKGTNEEPSVDIREPDRDENIDSDTIDVEVRAYDDKPGLLVEVRLDDGDWEEMDYVEDDDWVYTFTDVDDGEHTIDARATDSDGAKDTDSVTFTVGQEETEEETSGSKQPPSLTPGFEFSFSILCLISLLVHYKRKKG